MEQIRNDSNVQTRDMLKAEITRLLNLASESDLRLLYYYLKNLEK